MRADRTTPGRVRRASCIGVTLRMDRPTHAICTDAAEVDGKSLNSEIMWLIGLGLGVRSKMEIVRNGMTRPVRNPPVRLRTNPSDPYSPIAKLPGMTYPGDPLVKRPTARSTAGAGNPFNPGASGFGPNGAFEVNPKMVKGTRAFYEAIDPPTDEEAGVVRPGDAPGLDRLGGRTRGLNSTLNTAVRR